MYLENKMSYTWSRTQGYEVSSIGDKRFSAFHAIMPDGRSLEMHYQCDVKGYDVGGTNWWLGIGKPPLKEVDTWKAYLNLWIIWAHNNMPLIYDLWQNTRETRLLRDSFARTPINQAHALSRILNNLEWLIKE